MKTSKGFSLAETLMALAIVALILGAAGQLLHNYSATMKQAKNQQATFSAIQFGLQEILDDTRQATNILAPAPDASFPELRFLRYLPGFSWLPTAIPSPLPTSWDPRAPDSLMGIRYRLLGNVLIRELSDSSFSNLLDTQTVAENVAGIDFARDSQQRISVRLSLREERRIVLLQVETEPPRL